MSWDFSDLLKKLIKTTFSIILGLLLIFHPFGQNLIAAKATMSGDFVKDTISVSQTLKETIDLPKSSEGLSEEEQNAVFLINDYNLCII